MKTSNAIFAEWLLNLVAERAENGEAVVFAKPQEWQGTKGSFSSFAQCAARLKSLTKPFLNWAGKTERQQISVPTLPLFVHERHSAQAILFFHQFVKGNLVPLLRPCDLLRGPSRAKYLQGMEGGRNNVSVPCY